MNRRDGINDSIDSLASYHGPEIEREYLNPLPPRKERHLQMKLKYHFMTPCEKNKIKPSWYKLAIQVLKILFINIGLFLFGNQRASHIDFLDTSEITFKHLYLKDWDPSYETLPYPPANGRFAIYTAPAFYDNIDYVLSRYNMTDVIALGAYDFATNRSHIEMCQTYYTKGFLNPSEDSYEYDALTVTDCFDLGSVTYCNGYDCAEIFDTRTFLDEEHANKSVSFDKLIKVVLRFSLKTIHLKDLTMPNFPDCLQFDIEVTFDNSVHSGQMLMSLDSSESIVHCKNYTISHAAGEVQLVCTMVLCVLTILLCIASLCLCVRSIYRALRLKQEAILFFDARGTSLPSNDRLEFINCWYVLIIINDVLIITAFVLKITIITKVYTNYHLFGLFLGFGNLLVWIGMLRYLGFFQGYNILMLTLKKSAGRVSRFLVGFFIFFSGYAICGWIVLGPYHLKFRRLSTSCECLFSLINGDDMFSTFSVIGDNVKSGFIWYISRFYLYTFICLFIYVILNILTAVILDAYDTVKHYHEPRSPLHEFINLCPPNAFQVQIERHKKRCCGCLPWWCHHDHHMEPDETSPLMGHSVQA